MLILPGVVDLLVLGWNFLKQVGTEIRCAAHEIIIPAGNRHLGWHEEKLSVAVVQQIIELDGTTEIHGVHGTRQRSISVESIAVRTSLGVGNVSTSFGASN